MISNQNMQDYLLAFSHAYNEIAKLPEAEASAARKNLKKVEYGVLQRIRTYPEYKRLAGVELLEERFAELTAELTTKKESRR